MKKINNLYFAIFIVGFLYFVCAHLYFGNFDLNIALSGWSALDFSNSIVFSQNFIHDYPGGAVSSGKNSILSWVYPSLQKLGISAEYTLVGMIGLEILAFTGGALVLFGTLFRKLPPAAYFTLATVFVLSWVRYPNLARFGAPYFHGQFYGFADGLRLLAIALFLRSQYRTSALALAFGFVIHPLKGLFGLIFIGGMHLARAKHLLRREVVVPFGAFCAFVAFWMWLWLGIGQGGDAMSSADFFRFSPLLNSHWYPQDLGVFGRGHLLYLSPFISAILLGCCVLIRQTQEDFPRYAIGAGILCLIILTAVGVGAAWFELNAFLVKSCFQRSTLLILSVVTILVVGQTFKDLESGKLGFVMLGGTAIAAAFVSKFTWPVFISLVYAALTLALCQNNEPFWKWMGRFLFGVVLIYLAVMWYLGFVKPSQVFYPDAYYNLQFYFLGLVCALAIFWIGARFFTEKRSLIHAAFLIFLVCLGGVNWAMTWRALPDAKVDKGRDYKAVQEWARDNTDRDALFMVDPCTSYGWRDYSVRSSFGTIQEWYKTGWLYSGDKQVFEDGISRGRELGLDVDTLVPEGSNWGPSRNFKTLCGAARVAFYSENGSTVSRISKAYDVDYLVFEKSQIARYGSGPQWPIAFENNSYRVLKSK